MGPEKHYSLWHEFETKLQKRQDSALARIDRRRKREEAAEEAFYGRKAEEEERKAKEPGFNQDGSDINPESCEASDSEFEFNDDGMSASEVGYDEDTTTVH